MQDVVEGIEDLIMDALRANHQPLDVATIIKTVRDQTNMRLPRSTVYGVLGRLVTASRATYVDDPGHPRRWSAIP